MNIFFLDKCPVKSAKYMCDKHIVKMIVESAQLLSSVIHEKIDNDIILKNIYKSTHKNHPMTLWVKKSSKNFEWLLFHSIELLKQYTERYKKVHKTFTIINFIYHLYNENFLNFVNCNFTIPPLCMPDYCKIDGDYVLSYRNYYKLEKIKFAKWKNSNIPFWFNQF